MRSRKDMLLATSNLTLKSAVDTATAMEAAARSAKQIHSNNAVGGEINRVGNQKFNRGRANQSQSNQQSSSVDRKECHRCGSQRHSPDDCFFRNKQCFYCKIVGHSKHKCKKRFSSQDNSNRRSHQGRVNWEGTEEISNEAEVAKDTELRGSQFYNSLSFK